MIWRSISLVVISLLASGTAARAASCESLGGLKLADTTITLAEVTSAGTLTPPYGSALESLPSFCRVAGRIAPSRDSDIYFEVWLPASGWNGKFLGVGNGGFAGALGYGALASNLKRGYATAATDTGHDGQSTDATWAFHHPEKVTDFGYRALHLTMVNAKSLVQAFYGKPAERSYFDSCSDGGREALMEAQRFPEDFDGILAGAPANYWTHLLASALTGTQALYSNPSAYFSDMKLPAIHAAVLAACDAADGVKDGVINDPPRCHFDPAVLLCKGRETRTCLTASQVATLKALYQDGKDAHGRQIFPGLMPGAEDGPGGWGPWIVGQAPGQGLMPAFVDNYFRYMVFEDPAWTPFAANIGTAIQTADEKTAHALNAIDPDLSRFTARGGKLILYHGWNDPAISPLNTIDYYRSVTKTVGAEKAAGFLRLYMVPGMQHCLGGPGATSFGQLGTTTAKGENHGLYTALEEWVEKGTPPSGIVATKFTGDNPSKPAQMTRPLCAYPEIPKYKGTGDTNDDSNFTCAAN
jgi:feruloyl esterase